MRQSNILIEVLPEKYKDEQRSFGQFLKKKGFKVSFKHVDADIEVNGLIADGCIVTIVDPMDPSEICFARFLSYAEMKLIRHSCDIFWRYV